MKITRRQLRRIIKEERAKLHEGWKEEEMDLIDEIVDSLIQRGAIGTVGDAGMSYDAEPDYKGAAEYLRTAVIPALLSLAGD